MDYMEVRVGLNLESPDFKSGTQNHSTTLPPIKIRIHGLKEFAKQELNFVSIGFKLICKSQIASGLSHGIITTQPFE